MDAELQRRIEHLCDQLSRWPDIKATIAAGHGGANLQELSELLQANGEIDDGRVSKLLDEIGNAAARGGLPGVTSRPRGPIPSLPPGMFPRSHEPPQIRKCPLRHSCSRIILSSEAVLPSTHDGLPICAMGATPMAKYPPGPQLP